MYSGCFSCHLVLLVFVLIHLLFLVAKPCNLGHLFHLVFSYKTLHGERVSAKPASLVLRDLQFRSLFLQAKKFEIPVSSCFELTNTIDKMY